MAKHSLSMCKTMYMLLTLGATYLHISNGFSIPTRSTTSPTLQPRPLTSSFGRFHPKPAHSNPTSSFSPITTTKRTATSSTSLHDLATAGDLITNMSRQTAEQLAGPFFGISLFPYLGFLYLLNVEENNTPKGVTVGFATCLLFVFLTIPAAIASEVLYGVSLADSDWLHGSAESLLTITNLVTVVAFRQALNGMETAEQQNSVPPQSAIEYRPMVNLVAILTVLAGVTALVPAALGAEVHTPYLNGFMDLPAGIWESWFGRAEPDNALTVACWIIHISSLVEFLVAMGFVWRWADIVQNPKWKGLTWGLLPLHSSGITACTYHLFYNQIPILVPLQAFLTCVGNTTAMYATYRIAISNGWTPLWTKTENEELMLTVTTSPGATVAKENKMIVQEENPSLIGFEDLGNALANDNDYTFLIKLFLGCAVGSYVIKYGETFFDFPFDANLGLALGVIFIPSLLNAYKWYRRSSDATFEGWF